jgi:hypothetical protein
MFLLALVACFFLLGFATPAHAMELGIQDQGADTQTLLDNAHVLGATTVRIVARPGQPHLEQVQAYRAAGLKVQAAILVKRQTTPQDVMSLVRSWRGMVGTVSVGNEPELNGVPACRYVWLVNRTLPRLKKMGITTGFLEVSPVAAFEYIHKIARCAGARRIRADFTGVHPYQFFSDPLGAPTEHSGVGTWLGLGNLGSFRRALRRAVLPSRLRATEFSYLVDGRYKIPMAKAAGLWPRAVKQARRWTDQLVIYGMGEVHDSSTWGSASLLDRYGRITVAYRALVKALGRDLPREPDVAPSPQGTLLTPLPDLSDVPAPVRPDVAHGASAPQDDPIVVVDPPMTDDGPAAPPQDSSPAADEPAVDPVPPPTPELTHAPA